jgi:hypothetical protein
MAQQVLCSITDAESESTAWLITQATCVPHARFRAHVASGRVSRER